MKDGVYYDKNDIIVRISKLSDVNFLAVCLRQSDIDEIKASHNIAPYTALYKGLKESVVCLTVEDKEDVVAMFGVVPENLMGDHATIWFLASEKLDKIKCRFLRHSRRFIDMFLMIYPLLSNHVDVRNVKSIAWLRYLDAKIEEAKPFGFEGLPFRYFSFERGK